MLDAGLNSRYLACLAGPDRQDRAHHGSFVAGGVVHNTRTIGPSKYREMLRGDLQAIPDLRYASEPITVAMPCVACRLAVDCTAVGLPFGLPVCGRRVRFHENVFHRSENARIAQIWSIIDEAAIACHRTVPV